MTENLQIQPADIQNKIYTIRGLQVMIDRDIAIIYGVKSTRLREQVKRNIKRFPSDFMFQLTDIEVDFMVSQNAIPSRTQPIARPFLIIDSAEIYHFGASLKDLGKRWFAFSKFEKEAVEMLGRL
ncbi:MAG: ORF6N domain-containing protein [Paludibacteraceae bacterium]|nr:ORF6N domain-containing protein [Paludibacteraceae bacterium]